MREDDTLKLVRSLVVSRVTYSLSYQNMNLSEEQQAEIILRKAYKTALRLPICTSTEKLLALGAHNTFQEHKEVQLKAQTERLMQTPTGRTLLQQLGYTEQIREMSKTADIPDDIRRKFHVAPIPKNMDLNLHQAIVEKNPKKFKIDEKEIKSRKAFIEQSKNEVKELMVTQDDELEGIQTSVGTLKSMSKQIGNELDEQSVMLDDLGHDMDNAESKMDGALKKMAKVLHMSNGEDVVFLQDVLQFFIFINLVCGSDTPVTLRVALNCVCCRGAMSMEVCC
ncbi:hypothetical protein HPB48_001450 [Haemaphysalis longicornis]|uniref:t-SNARE coiled-coil homology domain-containing protein n=1 Tax=Haemaphysalis longicornis TaxID=44386 RepID=A0A9J6FF50_HAELO|nr:hypothetical protein HPB48_001450 [Haemaphysalis longicornis]